MRGVIIVINIFLLALSAVEYLHAGPLIYNHLEINIHNNGMCQIMVVPLDSIPKGSLKSTLKLSPKLSGDVNHRNKKVLWKILVDKEKENEIFQWLKNQFTLHSIHQSGNGIITFKSDDLQLDRIINHPHVLFVDYQWNEPTEELILESVDFSVNGVNNIRNQWPELNGADFGISIKEEQMDTNDIDLLGKYVDAGKASDIVANHSTTMATIIGGMGNSFIKGRGVAPAVKLSSSDFRELLPDEISNFPPFFRIQNHSYGTDIENYYGIEAMAYDAQVYDHPEMVHVFSAGNSGEESSENGTYQDVAGFANLTGNYKQAKNILTIGAVDPFIEVEFRSSKGPAFDGRVKPELVAFGEDGSSGAAALTSGVCVLLQQFYFEKFGMFPAQSLLRAALIASSEDIENPGPDFVSGYGLLKGDHALEVLQRDQYYKGALTGNDTLIFDITVEENLSSVQIALSWIDPPAMAGDIQVLKNDLEMRIIHPASGEVFMPWKLSKQADVDSLSNNAVRGEEHLTNNEMVTIEQPLPGNYQIIIYPDNELDTLQPFHVAYYQLKKDKITWNFPTASDTIIAGENQIIRWKNTFAAPLLGDLYIRSIGNVDWELVDQVELSKENLDWVSPNVVGDYQWMIEVDGQQFESDTFLISLEIVLDADTKCGDDLLLEWTEVPEASGYDIFLLEDNKMTRQFTSTTSFFTLDVNEYPTKYIAVASFLPDGGTGLRSKTIDLEFQNPVCYVQSFTGLQDMDKATVSLMLSSVTGVESVVIFVAEGDALLPIGTFDDPENLVLTAEYDLSPGENLFQYALQLSNGEVLTGEQVIIYRPEGFFNVFPTYIYEGEDVVIEKNPNQIAEFMLYNMQGQLSVRQTLRGSFVFIDTLALGKGMYIYQVLDGKEILQQGKIIIL